MARHAHRRAGRSDAAGSRRRVAVLLVTILAVVAADVVLLLSPPPGREPPSQRAAVDAFFGRYVDPDGRVVRVDQEGDTVSEGQAYALLMALATGDRDRFAGVWEWTAAHLRRDDGLLAWRWADGAVVDEEPASDADLTTAYALLLAGQWFGDAGYRQAGRDLADAVLEHLTVEHDDGVLLVAGTWATDPPVVNPSYLWTRATAALADWTGDGRWRQVRETSHELLATLMRAAPHLPPDWARLAPGGVIEPAAEPANPEGEPQFGLDAVRTLVWLAESCDPRGRRLAAAAWPQLRREDGDVPAVQTLDGTPLVDWSHPATLVGAAAAAHAAGEPAERDMLLARAAELDRYRPSYYGAVWVALGQVLLTTDLLGGCDARAGEGGV